MPGACQFADFGDQFNQRAWIPYVLQIVGKGKGQTILENSGLLYVVNLSSRFHYSRIRS